MPPPKATTSADPWADLVQRDDPWADLAQAKPVESDVHTTPGALVSLVKMLPELAGGLWETAKGVGQGLVSLPPGAEFGTNMAKDPMGTIRQTASGALQLAKDLPSTVGNYVNRYNPTTYEGQSGPTSNLRETLYHHPLGVLMDTSMAAKATGLVPGLQGVAAAATDPVETLLKPVTSGVTIPATPWTTRLHVPGLNDAATAMETGAKTAYTKAIKVPDTIRRRNPTVDIPATGLALRRPVSGAGIEAGSTAIGQLEDQIGQAVDTSPATAQLTAATMPQSAAEVAQAQTLSAVDPAKARLAPARLRGFLQDPNISTPVVQTPAPGGGLPTIDYQPNDLPMRSLQDMKVRLNQLLASRFGKDNTSLPGVEMNQAIRSDLRQTIADAVPDVADLNAQVSPQYALQDALEHRVPVAARQNMLPMRSMIGGTLIGGVGFPRKLAGAMLGAAVDNPAVLSQVAFGMDAASKRLSGLSKTMQTLAPYATANAFAQNVAGAAPDDPQAVGRLTTSAVQEATNQPGFAQLPLEQQMKVIDQVVSDVGVLTGGAAEVTQQKPRGLPLLKGVKAAQTTERPR